MRVSMGGFNVNQKLLDLITDDKKYNNPTAPLVGCRNHVLLGAHQSALIDSSTKFSRIGAKFSKCHLLYTCSQSFLWTFLVRKFKKLIRIIEIWENLERVLNSFKCT